MSFFRYVFPGGWVGGEETDVTLVNNTQLIYRRTFASNHRILLYGVAALNGDDVTRIIRIRIVDGSNNVLHTIKEESVGAGDRIFENLPGGLVLKGGWKVEFVFEAGGASSGGTGNVSLIFTELMAK